MSSYEKRADAHDRRYDKGVDKIDRRAEKLDEDIHPDRKLSLYDDLILMAKSLYHELHFAETMDPELFPNSKEVAELVEYYEKEKANFERHYDYELSEWREIEEEKKEARKRARKKKS